MTIDTRSPTMAAGSMQVVGLLAVNSVAFVRHVFDLYTRREPFAIMRSPLVGGLDSVSVTSVLEPTQGAGWLEGAQPLIHADAPAQIAFTSGTEGEPKGIVLSHRALADVVERLNEVMQLDRSVREYVGVPASYSFGLGRFRACAAVGGAAYLPPNGFDPLEIARMLKADEINALSAVPTLWRVLLNASDMIGSLGRKVRWIEIGSQYMSRREKEQLKHLFPNARIVQHYGLTEASRTTFLDISGTEGHLLESVGKAHGDVEVQIGEDERIRIRGPHVASGVVTKRGIVPITDAEGWLTTNDRGSIEDGHLFFHGRADDIINCGGIKINPEQVEERLCAALNIKGGVGVARITDRLRGDGIGIGVSAESGLSVNDVGMAARRIVESLGVRIGDALRVAVVDALPQTATGKMQRAVLSRALTPHDQPAAKPVIQLDESLPPATALQQQLIAVWQEVLGVQSVSVHTSFFEHGGDSLSAISVMLRMEKMGVDPNVARQILQGYTIAQVTADSSLQGAAPDTSMEREYVSLPVAANAINTTRGVLVLWLIAIHWLPGVFERLPSGLSVVHHYLNPLYRLGTPGFAIVFGLGVGFFYFPQMSVRSAGVARRVRIAAGLVLGGILMLAVTRGVVFALGIKQPDAPLPSALLYSVLAYYLMAVVSIPAWCRIVACCRSPIATALLMAAICFIANIASNSMLGHEQSSGVVDLMRLMLVAKYNYFTMTGTVMLGMAIGLHLRDRPAAVGQERAYTIGGLALAVFAVALSYHSGSAEQWLTMRTATLWAIVSYVGAILLLLALAVRMSRPQMRSRMSTIVLRVVAICGVLSLPAYVGHELVIPVKDVLTAIGVSSSVALAAVMAAFGGASAYAISRLYRLYHGGQ